MNKFLQVCIGVSIVLFASGFLIRSVQNVNAEVPASKFSTNKKIALSDSFSPVGISAGYAYYFSFDPNGFGTLRKAPLTDAD